VLRANIRPENFGAVNNSLKELLNWRLITTTQVLGDRRTYYQTDADVWALFRTIVQERKQREFDPTVRMLRKLVEAPDFAQEPLVSRQRVRDTLQWMNTLESWGDYRARAAKDASFRRRVPGLSVRNINPPTSESPRVLRRLFG